jgi:hypothetical protein
VLFGQTAVVDSVKILLTKATWTAPQKHVSVVDIVATWRLWDRGIADENLCAMNHKEMEAGRGDGGMVQEAYRRGGGGGGTIRLLTLRNAAEPFMLRLL